MLACRALADSIPPLAPGLYSPGGGSAGFPNGRFPERFPVVGELEKDITADAEPVSLAAAGI